MEVIEGIVFLKPFIGSDVLVINDVPIAKHFQSYNGEEVVLQIYCLETMDTYKGIADIFYFEGKQQYYRGTKYVNDLFIDDIDIVELLENFENEYVKLALTLVGANEHIVLLENGFRKR